MGVLPVVPDQIPDVLKQFPGWVLWKSEVRDGKETKPPYSTRGHHAKSNDPKTWASYDRALRAYQRPARTWDGIGIALAVDPRLLGVDLDHCIDGRTGEIALWALDVVRRLNSYTERSPSGTGLRIFLFADPLLKRGRKVYVGPETPGQPRPSIEAYEVGRYLTVTGHHLDGTPVSVEERPREAEAWCEETFTENGETGEPAEKKAPANLDLSDEELLGVARRAKNGPEIEALFRGDWEKRYESASEADLALCSHLGFYAQGDPARVDRMFRASGLMRDKWDRRHHGDGKTYGEGTIEKALAGMTEYWTPPGSYRTFEAANRNGRRSVEETISGEDSEGLKITGAQYHLSDLGNAQRLQYHHGKDIRYCHPWRKWLVWDGVRWAPDATAEIERRAVATVMTIFDEVKFGKDKDDRGRIHKHALDSESNKAIRAMLARTAALKGVPVMPGDLDSDPWKICVLNGVVNLKTGDLLAPERRLMMTKQAPVEFDPDAGCPLWERFLGKIFGGSEEMIAFIRRAVGYSLTGTVRERCFFVCHGEGANGKSTFFDVVSGMLGDYAQRTPTETLLMRREDALTNDLAALMGRRFVFASESEEERRLAVSRIKDITGRDKITARFLHQEFFTFEPEFKLWLATNHRPRITDTNRAIWDRIRLVPFNVTIERAKQDADLPEKLRSEWPGIFAWAVRGCLEWQTEGLAEPKAVTEATAAYRSAEDVTDQFLSEMTVKVDGMSVQADRLYQAYLGWATKGGEHPLSRRKFGERLREKGMESSPGAGGYVFWQGIKFAENVDEE